MHKTLRALIMAVLAAVPFAFAPAAAQDTTNLLVRINDGTNNMAGAKVVAVNFGMNGPSTYTVMGVTGGNGQATLTLTNNRNYNLYVSSQGFSPTLRDQFNNPDPSVQRHFWPTGGTLSSTITLTADVAEAGKIELGFVHATPNKVLFGSVNNNTVPGMGYSGIVQADGSGAGTLVVENVPYAAANTYNIGLYDPEKERGVGRSVMTELSAGVPLISYTGVSGADFDNSIPPSKFENTASDNNEGGSNLSVEGIVRSTEANWVSIPYNGVNFRSCNGGAWAKVDEKGRFQLYNLRTGATYYAEAFGGCIGSQSGPGDCFEPYRSPALVGNQDLCTGAAAKGSNDFVYLGGLQSVSIKLGRVPKSTGQIKVYVRSSSGFGIPNGGVNINPDGSAWSINSCASQQNPGTTRSNPGFSNANVNLSATGYALLDGLPSGNYMLNVWTPFSKNDSNGPSPFNDLGKDGFSWDWSNAHCSGTGDDDLRVTVDTASVPSLQVFDHLGNNLNLSSITVIVDTNLNMSGVIRGTVRFSQTADLRDNPMMINVNPQCGNSGCSGMGNMAVINSSGSDHYDYTLNVSSGFAYYMNVSVHNWGQVRTGGGDNNVHLESTGTAVVNMNFIPAGTITGTLYKPDGAVLTPANNQWIWVNAGSNNGWANAQLQKDGTFSIEGVLPGINRLSVNASGNQTSAWQYALPSPAPSVTVSANKTSAVDLNLVNASYVGIGLDVTKVPDASVITSGYDNLLGFKVMTMPAGTLLKGDTLVKMLAKGDEGQLEFRYSGVTDSSTEGPCGKSWNPAGFCAAQVPTPALYDFYLMRSGNFGDPSKGGPGAKPYPHFVLLSSSKSVVIDSAHATTLVRLPSWGGQATSSGVLVNLTPATDMHLRGNAALFGQVTADNLFRQADYDATGGDFDKFIAFLPVVALYDANGAFKAAGLVVPPPSFIADHGQDFNLAFAQGYQEFKALLALAPYFGFEIRGLAPSGCFTAVVTTPNYPPYQRKICVGADKSTTTVTVNLDAAVGSGATLQGVVTTTAATPVPLANAAVEISGEGIDGRTVVTSTTGAYKFEGLPEGTVRIKVSLGGYACAEAEKDVLGTAAFTQNFALTQAGGSITGTVYSQKMPYAKVQPGALIFAYDDTYNGIHPTAPLPLIKTRTGSDGTYELTGLIPGDTYKVFLKVPGKYILSQSTLAVSGTVAGIDFTMLAKPLDIELFARQGPDSYEFTVRNPQDFKSGAAWWCDAPFVSTSAATPLNLNKLSSGELRGTIPLGSLLTGHTYVLHVEAVSLSNKRVVRELLFGLGFKGNARQSIDNVIIGDDSDDGTGRRNNEAPMDMSGDDPSSLLVPAGVMLPISTGAIPSLTFKGADKNTFNTSALSASAFAGNIYTISLSSVSLNPDRGFDIVLAYDKDNSDLSDLAVARYNETTGNWDLVTGAATVNALKGTVKVRLKSLAGTSSVKGFGPAFSEFNGKEYVIRPRAAGVGVSSGTFAVVKPSVAGGTYGGSKVKVFNFPNPFNLKSKTTTPLKGGVGAQTTTGTTIHVDVPAANGGIGHIRIYTVSGELVRDLEASFTGDAYNYVNWDGRNKSGQEVANGVYYGVVELYGKKPGQDTTFKMAVIK